jgi:hypothetical protein
MVTEEIERIFQRRKKLADPVLKNRYFIWAFRLIISTPFLVLWRRILICLCRLQDKPYEDKWYPSYLVFLLKDWRVKNGFTIDKAATVLGMSEGEYRDYEYGYRYPDLSTGQWKYIKKHLHGEVDYSQTAPPL